jgi:hypothetical protein
MSDLIEYSFRSELLNWIRYFKSTEQLHVRFKTGGLYSYSNVPAWRIQELVNAPSAGKYFLQNIAHIYKYAQEINGEFQIHAKSQQPPQRVEPILKDIKEQSLANICDHLPEQCLDAVSQLLDIHPTLVRVVKVRKSKHGDHRSSSCERYSIVTVNSSGNAYQFLITLLHELAHAKTITAHGRTVSPHGSEWKHAFSDLLLNFLARELFPEALAPHVRSHAANPLYSSSSDRGLQFALRAYDTLDRRPMLINLAAGQVFILDGKGTLVKRERRKNFFRCVGLDGRSFYIPTLTRVDVQNQ